MINIKKLKAYQEKFEKRIIQELKDEVKDEVIQFIKTSFFEDHFKLQKSRKDTKQSSRVLYNWEKEGLIDKINTEEGKFRTYNKSQAIWLDIVTTLRDFGFPLDKIRIVKERLFGVLNNGAKFSVLEFAIMQSVLNVPIVLTIFVDGEINLLSQHDYNERLSIEPPAPHLHFNLLNLAKNEFPNNNFTTLAKEPKSGNLTEKELTLLYFIRTGDFENIKVRLKDGDIFLVEGTKKISPKSRITDIINKGDFQDIEIKTQNGEVVYISSTEKVRI